MTLFESIRTHIIFKWNPHSCQVVTIDDPAGSGQDRATRLDVDSLEWAKVTFVLFFRHVHNNIGLTCIVTNYNKLQIITNVFSEIGPSKVQTLLAILGNTKKIQIVFNYQIFIMEIIIFGKYDWATQI